MLFVFTASSAFGTEVLFVVGGKAIKAGDQTIKKHLENRGFDVVVKNDKLVKTEDARGKSLVLLSESARSKEVNTKFRDVTVPVICSEPYLFHDLGMTGETKKFDFGRKSRQKEMAIVNPAHPLAASLSDNVQVSTKSFFMGWGVPGKNAIPVAALKKDPEKSTIFAYEAGTEMPGNVAPARRVGLFLFRGTAKSFTPDAWSLFNAVVDWSIEEPPDSVLKAELKTEEAPVLPPPGR
ncbi:MAG: hypothetical protein HKO68_07295 [Desulfobacterales bacterium]|nr:hypothetical protein [Deltaproteobacteria bacterium]NNL76124.1 hypothetical protein [Desulfobacterales bacterium]